MPRGRKKAVVEEPIIEEEEPIEEELEDDAREYGLRALCLRCRG